jgi:hypothetical protein
VSTSARTRSSSRRGPDDRLAARRADRAPRGDTLRAPRGIPHNYRVESETARWLVFCEPAGFEEFVREVSESAPAAELPPAGRPHDLDAIAAAAAAAGIELLGPPGALPE